MSHPDISSMIADDDYFDAIIAGAEKTGLVLLGRAMIDTNTHAVCRPGNIHETEVPRVWYRRATTLIFHDPSKAICLTATYHENINPDHQKAREGIIDVKPDHPYWKIQLFLGAKQGMWEGYGPGKWLYISQSFSGVGISVGTNSRSGLNCLSSMPYKPDEDMFDGAYSILLGWWPIPTTPDVFKVAMRNLLNRIRGYARDGELSKKQTVGGISPWEKFASCDISFWEQVNPASLEGVFEEVQVDPEQEQVWNNSIMNVAPNS